MENNHIEIDNEIRNYFNELLLKSEISVDEEKRKKCSDSLNYSMRRTR